MYKTSHTYLERSPIEKFKVLDTETRIIRVVYDTPAKYLQNIALQFEKIIYVVSDHLNIVYTVVLVSKLQKAYWLLEGYIRNSNWKEVILVCGLLFICIIVSLVSAEI
ncbi:hypothetical protein BDF21DRAFT_404793 [Thamnidium elegans]|nr:hypothetical protein BDF21DRAFT_404793 [Thamnidium elegans]